MNAAPGRNLRQDGPQAFFKLAATWGALFVAVWLWFSGVDPNENYQSNVPLLWLRHEMLFGFPALVFAGVLLKIIPNGTGTYPVAGWGLKGLLAVWALGRIGWALAPVIGPTAVAVLDVPFLVVLTVLAYREVGRANSWGHASLVGIAAFYAVANILVHWQLASGSAAVIDGYVLASFLIAALVAELGGRLIPSLSNKNFRGQGRAIILKSSGKADSLPLSLLVILIFAEVGAPESEATSVLALLTGVVFAGRLIRWRPYFLSGDVVLLAMCFAYAWFAAGLILLGLGGMFGRIPEAVAHHALLIGGFGTLSMALMIKFCSRGQGRLSRSMLTVEVPLLLVTLSIIALVVHESAGGGGHSFLIFGILSWIAAFFGAASGFDGAAKCLTLTRSSN